MTVDELEKFIARHKHNELEIRAEIGGGRYKAITTAIRTEIEKAGLTEWQAQNVLSHLSDIFRLERIRV